MKKLLSICVLVSILVSCKKANVGNTSPVFTSIDTVSVTLIPSINFVNNGAVWTVYSSFTMSPYLSDVTITADFNYQIWDGYNFIHTQDDNYSVNGKQNKDVLPYKLANPSVQEVLFDNIKYTSTGSIYHVLVINY